MTQRHPTQLARAREKKARAMTRPTDQQVDQIAGPGARLEGRQLTTEAYLLAMATPPLWPQGALGKLRTYELADDGITAPYRLNVGRKKWSDYSKSLVPDPSRDYEFCGSWPELASEIWSIAQRPSNKKTSLYLSNPTTEEANRAETKKDHNQKWADQIYFDLDGDGTLSPAQLIQFFEESGVAALFQESHSSVRDRQIARDTGQPDPGITGYHVVVPLAQRIFNPFCTGVAAYPDDPDGDWNYHKQEWKRRKVWLTGWISGKAGCAGVGGKTGFDLTVTQLCQVRYVSSRQREGGILPEIYVTQGTNAVDYQGLLDATGYVPAPKPKPKVVQAPRKVTYVSTGGKKGTLTYSSSTENVFVLAKQIWGMHEYLRSVGQTPSQGQSWYYCLLHNEAANPSGLKSGPNRTGFNIRTANGIERYHCWGDCGGDDGDVVQFYSKLHNVTLLEAALQLVELKGYDRNQFTSRASLKGDVLRPVSPEQSDDEEEQEVSSPALAYSYEGTDPYYDDPPEDWLNEPVPRARPARLHLVLSNHSGRDEITGKIYGQLASRSYGNAYWNEHQRLVVAHEVDADDEVEPYIDTLQFLQEVIAPRVDTYQSADHSKKAGLLALTDMLKAVAGFAIDSRFWKSKADKAAAKASGTEKIPFLIGDIARLAASFYAVFGCTLSYEQCLGIVAEVGGRILTDKGVLGRNWLRRKIGMRAIVALATCWSMDLYENESMPKSVEFTDYVKRALAFEKIVFMNKKDLLRHDMRVHAKIRDLEARLASVKLAGGEESVVAKGYRATIKDLKSLVKQIMRPVACKCFEQRMDTTMGRTGGLFGMPCSGRLCITCATINVLPEIELAFASFKQSSRQGYKQHEKFYVTEAVFGSLADADLASNQYMKRVGRPRLTVRGFRADKPTISCVTERKSDQIVIMGSLSSYSLGKNAALQGSTEIRDLADRPVQWTTKNPKVAATYVVGRKLSFLAQGYDLIGKNRESEEDELARIAHELLHDPAVNPYGEDRDDPAYDNYDPNVGASDPNDVDPHWSLGGGAESGGYMDVESENDPVFAEYTIPLTYENEDGQRRKIDKLEPRNDYYHYFRRLGHDGRDLGTFVEWLMWQKGKHIIVARSPRGLKWPTAQEIKDYGGEGENEQLDLIPGEREIWTLIHKATQIVLATRTGRRFTIDEAIHKALRRPSIKENLSKISSGQIAAPARAGPC